jgi:hypothetical protein
VGIVSVGIASATGVSHTARQRFKGRAKAPGPQSWGVHGPRRVCTPHGR